MKLAVIAAALLLMGAAPAQKIAGEVRSWGHVQQAWSVDTQGEARFTVREGNDFNAYYLVTRRADVGLEGFNEVARMVKPLRSLVGVDPKCEPGATDGPYGLVTWTGADAPVRFAFNSNCASQQTASGFFWNDQAQEQVRRWTADGQIVERKWMGAPWLEPK